MATETHDQSVEVPTVPRDIADYLDAVHDPNSLLPQDAIDSLKGQLDNTEDPPPPAIRLALETQIRKLQDVTPQLAELQAGFEKALPDYAKTVGLDLEEVVDVIRDGYDVPKGLLDGILGRSSRRSGGRRVTRATVVAWLNDTANPTTLTKAHLVEATGASPNTVDRVLKDASADGNAESDGGSPAVWNITRPV